ncbi:Restriction endonuclease [Bacillus sp. OV322]|uniref:restriction endonuclease n=1 Tax=Bacillus sp. OV322 TaxID=1882764 RepID=UPI0008EA93AA|nr:restriction endonuclease [Bacillus sp. OV322]SFC65118.1 Restriction endonuclease [Bacillus sp. OV322]
MSLRLHLLLWIALILVPIFVFIKTSNWETVFLTFIVELFIYCVYGLFWLRSMLKKQNDSEIWIINKLTDEELENFTAPLLTKLGYTVTKPNEDNQNISFLLTTPTGNKAIVKVKSHNRGVGIRLVQRIYKQMDFYDAAECWVITNHQYSPKAMEFAEANNMRLIGREEFIQWILQVKNQKNPRITNL